MLPKAPYRLALDIGSTSIGWCLLKLDADSEPKAIIRMGVRIFPDGRNPKDGSSLAVTRRNARAMRRRRDRLLKRKERLLNALTRLGFFPQDDTQRQALVQLDPYALRQKGLHEPLTGPEFARALFHINQRRGFLSNRKTDKKDNDSGALKKAIKDLREKLAQENCQTLGEWLAKRHTASLSVRARLHGKTQKDKAYDFYADRAMIEHEFDALWSKQSSLNLALFTEAARAELKDVLLHQRPLKPVRPGRCTLLPEEERAPLALPSTQRFRIYQELNNLRLLTPDLREVPLTLEQRNKIAELLERQGEVRFTAMLKALKLPGTTKFILEDIKRDRLKGNATAATLAKDSNFGDAWFEFDPILQDRGKRKFVVTTDSKHKLPIMENLLDRNFIVEAPNQVWTSDITYIATDEGWLYLSAVIDLFSRQVVGWSMKPHMQTSVVTDALHMAWFRRRPAPGLIFHSDRGSQYCSHDFQKTLKGYKMKSSMSRKGNCWDNAPTESLWGRLKVGRLYGRRFATRRDAMDEVIDWLTFYNHKRLHSTLGYVSPMTFEQRWIAAQQQDRKSA